MRFSAFGISLQRENGRRKNLIHQFTEVLRLKDNFHIVDAVDGNKTDREILVNSRIVNDHDYPQEEKRWHQLQNDPPMWKLSESEIGCMLSHIAVWNIVIKNRIDYALICEDDVLFQQELDCVELISSAPSHLELLFLGYLNPKATDQQRLSGQYQKIGIYPICRNTGGAHAYIVSREGAEKLFLDVFPLRYPADGFLGRMSSWNRVNAYGVSPVLALQGSIHAGMSSTIERGPSRKPGESKAR